ncbi:uncharacterized protein Z520_05337 [Fonsecaea multimorphosa CBS 102226]|uniref:Uncharacterized protein n=1 Tax=Fonsecaea multimorphosa CBS 102226 TaxID=1442371 RepID=A0A0D2IPM5_9EURO|nr:uncharacterized protein Z520_05337 [Fonsecaea multimorphosa CBS 102226]KIX98876.1 hypothetical protein Z520_05337 [Fonsecaea multimorphosa CBS 102226]
MGLLRDLFQGESVLVRDYSKTRYGSRKILLIAMAVGQKYQKIAEGLSLVGIDLAPSPSSIDWSKTSDMSSLPRISAAKLDIAVHYAIAVMEKSVYYDSRFSMSKKMRDAKVWEHVGGDGQDVIEAGDSHCLGKEDLHNIYAIKEVGETKLSDTQISEKFYRKLMTGWEYFSLWWNCHDLAIRLAYLIVSDKSNEPQSPRRFLAKLLVRLKNDMLQAVRHAISIGHGAILPCIGGIMTFGAFFLPVVSATWIAILLGVQCLEEVGTQGMDKCREYIKRLQEDFPSLDELHKGLYKELSKEERRTPSTERIRTSTSNVSRSRNSRLVSSRSSKP